MKKNTTIVKVWPFTDIKQKQWQQIEPFFQELFKEEINDASALKEWLKKRSGLSSQISEDRAWRYIRMTCATADEALKKNYEDFVENIEPHLQDWGNKLDKKILNLQIKNQIGEEEYKLLFKRMDNEDQLFRKENIPLLSQENKIAMEFTSLSGAMTVTEEGQELTMQQAAALLKDNDRQKRERVFKNIWQRRLQDEEKLHDVMSRLVDIRTRIAQNAGFKNYRDYRFQELFRVDYGVQECFQFHEAIEKKILPLVDKIHRKRKDVMQLSALKPWDLAVDPQGQTPPKLFTSGDELSQKAIEVLSKIDTYFSECLSTMREQGFLDLESRKNKAPGGYNYPLAESGIPFIFMNAAGTFSDISTMLHESGHAVHSFLTRGLELVDFKHTPSEVAELASMSMELFSMKYWDVFLQDKNASEKTELLHKAIREQLEGVLLIFPWVAVVDSFQHWLYENPKHSADEREQKWQEIYQRFLSKEVDFSDVPNALKLRWQAQMHIFEVPFYYIEYAIAQLGAVANWLRFLENPAQALQTYKEALALGYTRSIPDIYKTSGIEFNFSADYVGRLASQVENYLDKL